MAAKQLNEGRDVEIKLIFAKPVLDGPALLLQISNLLGAAAGAGKIPALLWPANKNICLPCDLALRFEDDKYARKRGKQQIGGSVAHVTMQFESRIDEDNVAELQEAIGGLVPAYLLGPIDVAFDLYEFAGKQFFMGLSTTLAVGPGWSDDGFPDADLPEVQHAQ
jgi:hypothetical protein